MKKDSSGSWMKTIAVIVLLSAAYNYATKKEEPAYVPPATYYPASNLNSSYSNTNSNRYYEREEVSEPENPYDEGSGHSAGYEWAEENDPSDCDGNSQSFIEGCQEYLDEQEAYQDSQDEDSEQSE